MRRNSNIERGLYKRLRHKPNPMGVVTKLVSFWPKELVYTKLNSLRSWSFSTLRMRRVQPIPLRNVLSPVGWLIIPSGDYRYDQGPFQRVTMLFQPSPMCNACAFFTIDAQSGHLFHLGNSWKKGRNRTPQPVTYKRECPPYKGGFWFLIFQKARLIMNGSLWAECPPRGSSVV